MFWAEGLWVVLLGDLGLALWAGLGVVVGALVAGFLVEVAELGGGVGFGHAARVPPGFVEEGSGLCVDVFSGRFHGVSGVWVREEATGSRSVIMS